MSNYTALTPEAATRIAADFDMSEFADDLFGLVQRTAEACARIDKRPKHMHKRKALDDILKALRKLHQALETHQNVLAQVPDQELIEGFGRHLDGRMLSAMLGRSVTPIPRHSTRFHKAEELEAMDRVAAVGTAGPTIMIELNERAIAALESALTRLKSRRGAPAKDLYRSGLMMELARNYPSYFDQRPTSTVNGHFSKFCAAIVQELELYDGGFDDAVETALMRAGFASSCS